MLKCHDCWQMAQGKTQAFVVVCTHAASVGSVAIWKRVFPSSYCQLWFVQLRMSRWKHCAQAGENSCLASAINRYTFYVSCFGKSKFFRANFIRLVPLYNRWLFVVLYFLSYTTFNLNQTSYHINIERQFENFILKSIIIKKNVVPNIMMSRIDGMMKNKWFRFGIDVTSVCFTCAGKMISSFENAESSSSDVFEFSSIQPPLFDASCIWSLLLIE